MNLIPRKFYLDDIFDDMPMPHHDAMKCDIYEKGGDYHIEIDIPGFNKEDITIECEDGYLNVVAEKEFNNDEEDDKKYIRRERRYGRYERTFYIGDVDSDNIKAEFKHGILSLVVPKEVEKETKKKIEIEG